MKRTSERLSQWLLQATGRPIQALLDDNCEWTLPTIEAMGKTICGNDFLFIRDVMTRKHWKAFGPDMTDEQIMSPETDHLGFSVIEIDVDTYEWDAIIEIVNLTEAYRV